MDKVEKKKKFSMANKQESFYVKAWEEDFGKLDNSHENDSWVVVEIKPVSEL